MWSKLIGLIKGEKRVKLSAMLQQVGGKEFTVKSKKTGNLMVVNGKVLGEEKFFVKMLSGEKKDQILVVEDSERYDLVDDKVTKRKKELRLEITNLNTKLVALEQELDGLENAN
jgi:hypothetical protein